MIEESYVSFETAKLLKEAGFDEVCNCFYENSNGTTWNMIERPSMMDGWLPRPTQDIAARWLREYYGIHVSIEPYANMWHWILWKINGTFISNSSKAVKKEFESYEEAMETGLQEALRIIIKNKGDRND